MAIIKTEKLWTLRIETRKGKAKKIKKRTTRRRKRRTGGWEDGEEKEKTNILMKSVNL